MDGVSIWALAPLVRCFIRSLCRRGHVAFKRYHSVGNMAAVVWRIEVFAVPACRETDRGADTTLTELVGEPGRVIGTDAWRSLVVSKRVFYKASVANASGFSS